MSSVISCAWETKSIAAEPARYTRCSDDRSSGFIGLDVIAHF